MGQSCSFGESGLTDERLQWDGCVDSRRTAHQLAGHCGFTSQLVSDVNIALHLDCGGAPGENVHLDAKLIAGRNRLAELRAFDAGEYHELLAAIGNFSEQERSAGLGDSLDDQYSRHDGKPGKVSHEIWFIRGYIFDRD